MIYKAIIAANFLPPLKPYSEKSYCLVDVPNDLVVYPFVTQGNRRC